LAKNHKRVIAPLTVGITGSVGKTTTKQFIYSVLKEKYTTHKTDGNFNNEIGMPITILRMPCDTEALVLEMGMSFKGEISRLTRIAEPDIAVITNVGSSHIENLGSREGIRDAKMEIAEGLREGGKLVLNGDEPLLAGVDGAIYVSMENEDSDYRAVNVKEMDGYYTFDIACAEGIVKDFRINVLGIHNVYNAVLSYAVGKIAGMEDEDIRRGLLNFENAAMRQNIYENDGYTVIEDCYNASPESMKASLKVLCSKAKENRKVAVLGDMLELGAYSETLHRAVGAAVVELGIDKLFTFGKLAEFIAKGAIEAGMKPCDIVSITDADCPEAMADAIKQEVRDNDTLLFKASRGIKLERITEILNNKE